MESNPLISIIIPTYNRGNLIKKTIDSVLNQTFLDFEIIVVDDGSTDTTEEVVKTISEKKLSYYKIKNSERGAARNYGASKAKGKYITFLDSDDIFQSNHLETAHSLIKIKNDPAVFHLGYNVIDENGKTISEVTNLKGNITKKLITTGNFFSCMGVFVRSDIFKINQFNEDRNLSGSEDYELWIRIAIQYPFEISSTVTASIINHPDRSVINVDKEKLITRILLLNHLITTNPNFIKNYGHLKSKLISNTFSYISLHLAMAKGHKKEARYYLRKSIALNPASVFSRRFMAIVKMLITR